jgi:hypothetical protein
MNNGAFLTFQYKDDRIFTKSHGMTCSEMIGIVEIFKAKTLQDNLKTVKSPDRVDSNAVTSEAGTAAKAASNSPSGVRTDCLPVVDREDAAISQQSQPDSRETMSSPKGDSE